MSVHLQEECFKRHYKWQRSLTEAGLQTSTNVQIQSVANKVYTML